MKKEFQRNSKKGGIYQIRNLKNRKVYIGSAKCFKVRASQHESRLNSGKHHNKHLFASWNKYGSENFLFEILEVVGGDRLQRAIREQYYIDQYLDKWEMCYNIEKKSILNEPWTKTTDAKIKQNILKESAKKYKNTCLDKYGVEHPNQLIVNKEKLRIIIKSNKNFLKHQFQKGYQPWIKGKTHSAETRKKISEINSGRTSAFMGKKHTQQTKEKISKSKIGKQTGMKHPRAKVYENIFLLASDGTLYTKIECLSSFAREHNLSTTHLCALLAGKRKSHHNWKLVTTLAARIL